MSRKHEMNRNNKTITPPQKNKRNVFVAAGIVLVALFSLGLWWWFDGKSDFEKLQGKWVRTDGGYILEVKQIAADGKMDITYLNPQPINVSKATASSEAGQTKIFVELRDRLYPGSYYTLTYDKGKNQLSGMYYHLGIGQQFDVVFVRMK